MNRLIIQNGLRAGEVVDLAGGAVTIGSDAVAANVILTDENVASVHCRIAPVRGGGFGIQDLGSQAGTLVNGKRTNTTRLAPGDRLQIGTVEITFESDAIVEAPTVTTDKPRTPPPPAPARTQPAKGRESDPNLTGTTIGGYEVAGVLGRGGMGTVYKATQTSLHRTVALKVLSPALAGDPKFVDLFLREARAAAQLHHPNVVTIFDVGSGNGMHYFSMELFDGGSAEQLLKKEKKLAPRRALEIARDAARALEFAESKRLLHRDVKPDNLMITAQGVAKLADLGLASRRGDAGAARFGTPHFLAPECIRGAAGDHRADLYSLGATLFRMLTGRTPFQGQTVQEILDDAQSREAPALRSVEPGIPEPVEALVARLLQKDPAKRPASAREVASAIDAILTPAAAAASRSPIWIVGGIVALLGLGGGIYLFTRPGNDEKSEPVIIRDTDLESRLREENLQKEKEMREKDAEIAYTKIKAENLPPADRALKFDEVVARFSGTSAATSAATEAAKIREEERTRLAREAERQQLIVQFTNTLATELQARLSDRKFIEAMQLPSTLPGFSAALEDPEAKPAIAVVPDRVTASVEMYLKEEMQRAQAALGAGDTTGAETIYRTLSALLDGLLQLPGAVLPESNARSLRLQKSQVAAAFAHLKGTGSAAGGAAGQEASLAFVKLLIQVFELYRGGDAPGALRLMSGAANAPPAEFQPLFAELSTGADAVGKLINRAIAASTARAVSNDMFADPATGKPAKIISIEEAGVRFEPKGGPAGAVTLARWVDIQSSHQLVELLSRFSDRNGAGQLELARGAFFIIFASDLAPLRRYQFTLKPDAPAATPPPLLQDAAFQIAIDAVRGASLAGAPSAEADPLLKMIESERAAASLWRAGLAAFAAGQYSNAVTALGELLQNHRTTGSFLLSSDGSPPAPKPPR